jgi:hypothetical protein
MAAEIDWDEIGTLYSSAYLAPHEVRTDPLWILVTTARQGHESPLETMHIVMSSGARYEPEGIAALALRPDRKGFP